MFQEKYLHSQNQIETKNMTNIIFSATGLIELKQILNSKSKRMDENNNIIFISRFHLKTTIAKSNKCLVDFLTDIRRDSHGLFF